MEQKQYDEIKATFPWQERTVTINGRGGFVQMLDNRGQEVPLFVMTKFLEMITVKLMKVEETKVA